MALLFQLTQKLAQGFSAFWVRWPRKVGRLEAEHVWKKHVTPADEEPIHTALDWQIPIFQATEEKYIPHAKTWLRNRRWEDEKPTPKTVTLNPAIGRRLDDAIQHQNVTAQIQFLVSRGMTLEAAKHQVYLEMGWIKE